MSTKLLARVVTIACCLGFGLFVFADEEKTNESKIQELHSQKQSLLEDIVSRYRFAYSRGKPVLDELLDMEHQLLVAKIDAADSHADRVKLREAIVKNRREIVEARDAGMRMGKNTEVDTLSAKVMLIDAELALANELSHGGPTK